MNAIEGTEQASETCMAGSRLLWKGSLDIRNQDIQVLRFTTSVRITAIDLVVLDWSHHRDGSDETTVTESNDDTFTLEAFFHQMPSNVEGGSRYVKVVPLDLRAKEELLQKPLHFQVDTSLPEHAYGKLLILRCKRPCSLNLKIRGTTLEQYSASVKRKAETLDLPTRPTSRLKLSPPPPTLAVKSESPGPIAQQTRHPRPDFTQVRGLIEAQRLSNGNKIAPSLFSDHFEMHFGKIKSAHEGNGSPIRQRLRFLSKYHASLSTTSANRYLDTEVDEKHASLSLARLKEMTLQELNEIDLHSFMRSFEAACQTLADSLSKIPTSFDSSWSEHLNVVEKMCAATTDRDGDAPNVDRLPKVIAQVLANRDLPKSIQRQIRMSIIRALAHGDALDAFVTGNPSFLSHLAMPTPRPSDSKLTCDARHILELLHDRKKFAIQVSNFLESIESLQRHDVVEDDDVDAAFNDAFVCCEIIFSLLENAQSEQEAALYTRRIDKVGFWSAMHSLVRNLSSDSGQQHQNHVSAMRDIWKKVFRSVIRWDAAFASYLNFFGGIADDSRLEFWSQAMSIKVSSELDQKNAAIRALIQLALGRDERTSLSDSCPASLTRLALSALTVLDKVASLDSDYNIEDVMDRVEFRLIAARFVDADESFPFALPSIVWLANRPRTDGRAERVTNPSGPLPKDADSKDIQDFCDNNILLSPIEDPAQVHQVVTNVLDRLEQHFGIGSLLCQTGDSLRQESRARRLANNDEISLAVLLWRLLRGMASFPTAPTTLRMLVRLLCVSYAMSEPPNRLQSFLAPYIASASINLLLKLSSRPQLQTVLETLSEYDAPSAAILHIANKVQDKCEVSSKTVAACGKALYNVLFPITTEASSKTIELLLESIKNSRGDVLLLAMLDYTMLRIPLLQDNSRLPTRLLAALRLGQAILANVDLDSQQTSEISSILVQANAATDLDTQSREIIVDLADHLDLDLISVETPDNGIAEQSRIDLSALKELCANVLPSKLQSAHQFTIKRYTGNEAFKMRETNDPQLYPNARLPSKHVDVYMKRSISSASNN